MSMITIRPSWGAPWGTVLALVLLVGALLVAFPGKANADTFTVDTPLDARDDNPGDGECAAEVVGDCALRAAIQEANALEGPDTINLPAGTYALTITNPGTTPERPSGNPEDGSETGDLDTEGELTIRGAGAGATTIRDAVGDRVFDVPHDARAGIFGLTIADGDSDRGGGVFNDGVTRLRNVVIRDNEADFGGGVGNAGDLRMERVTVSDNTAFFGGGAYNEGTSFTLNDSTMSGNMAQRSTNGPGGLGGAIYNNTTNAKVTNSTIGSNTAEARGGGIANIFGDLTLLNDTLNENGAPAGSNVANLKSRTFLKNTIVANAGGGGNDCSGERTISRGHNIADDGSCSLNERGDQPNKDPRLGPLVDNGGPTLTYEPQSGSLAIDRADNGACPPADQRGIKRPKDGDGNGTLVCDVGAVEKR